MPVPGVSPSLSYPLTSKQPTALVDSVALLAEGLDHLRSHYAEIAVACLSAAGFPEPEAVSKVTNFIIDDLLCTLQGLRSVPTRSPFQLTLLLLFPFLHPYDGGSLRRVS